MLALFYQDGDSFEAADLGQQPATADYIPFSGFVTVPAGTVRVRVDLRLWGAAGEATWDQLQFSSEPLTLPDPDPEPWQNHYAVYQLKAPGGGHWTATVSSASASITKGDPYAASRANYLNYIIENPPEAGPEKKN